MRKKTVRTRVDQMMRRRRYGEAGLGDEDFITLRIDGSDAAVEMW